MNTEIKIYKTYPNEAKTVREQVFIQEQDFSYDYDEIDLVATHFVMFENSLPVAACRVFRDKTPTIFVLGRLAVKKECRGKNFGSLMLAAAKEYVSQAGGESLILHSQLQAKEFYAKNGFKEYGAVEYEEDCPHIWMKFQIK